MHKKILTAICAAVIIFAAIYQSSLQVTLTVGIFAGSNWEVPQGETYAIIDEVIKNFESENPNVIFPPTFIIRARSISASTKIFPMRFPSRVI